VAVLTDAMIQTGPPNAPTDTNLPASLVLLAARTGVPVRRIALATWGWGSTSLAVDDARGHLFVVDGQTVRMVDLRSGTVLRSVGLGADLASLAVDERANRLAVVAAQGLTLLDATTLRPVRRVTLGSGITSVAVDETAGRLYAAVDASTSSSGTAVPAEIAVLDARSGAIVRTIPVGRTPWTLAMDTAAGRLYGISYSDDPVTVLDTHTGTLLATAHL